MITILYGNEPYLIQAKVKQCLENLNYPDMNHERVVNDNVDSIIDSLAAMPFMDSYRVIQWSPTSIKVLGTKGLMEKAINSSNLLFVQLQDVDRREKIYKDNKQYFLKCDKEDSYEMLKQSIVSCFNKDAYEEYLRRIDYLNNPEVSFYPVVKEVEQLLCISNPITLEVVKNNIKEYIEQNTFGVSRYIVSGDIEKVMAQREVAEKDTLLLGALFYELKIAYKAKIFPLDEIGGRENAFFGLSREVLAKMIAEVNQALNELKSSDAPKSIIAREVLTSLCVACK